MVSLLHCSFAFHMIFTPTFQILGEPSHEYIGLGGGQTCTQLVPYSCYSIWLTTFSFGIMAVWVDVSSGHHHLYNLPTSQRRFRFSNTPTSAIFAPSCVQTSSCWTFVLWCICSVPFNHRVPTVQWMVFGNFRVILGRESLRVSGYFLLPWQRFVIWRLIEMVIISCCWPCFWISVQDWTHFLWAFASIWMVELARSHKVCDPCGDRRMLPFTSVHHIVHLCSRCYHRCCSVFKS